MNNLLSNFNEHVWQEFGRSPRIPQLITRYNRLDKRAPILVVDAIKCRRQLLAHLSPCVFSVWDEIRPVKNRKLMDFMLISKAAPANQTELQMMAPHLGPAWRTKETAAWLLNRCIMEWRTFRSVSTLPAASPRCTVRRRAVEGADSGNQSINSMMGLWSNPRQFTFHSRTHEPGMDDTVFDGERCAAPWRSSS